MIRTAKAKICQDYFFLRCSEILANEEVQVKLLKRINKAWGLAGLLWGPGRLAPQDLGKESSCSAQVQLWKDPELGIPVRYLSTAVEAAGKNVANRNTKQRWDKAEGMVTTVIVPIGEGDPSETPEITSRHFEYNQFLAGEVAAINRKYITLFFRYRLEKWTISVT